MPHEVFTSHKTCQNLCHLRNVYCLQVPITLYLLWGLVDHFEVSHKKNEICIYDQILPGDSWHSSKIIRADEKNTGFI